VKKVWSSDWKVAAIWRDLQRRGGQAVSRELHELRNGFEIPVRVGGMDMAEIRRELRQFAVHIEPSSIPSDQGLRCEAMAQILNAGAMPVASAVGWRS